MAELMDGLLGSLNDVMPGEKCEMCYFNGEDGRGE